MGIRRTTPSGLFLGGLPTLSGLIRHLPKDHRAKSTWRHVEKQLNAAAIGAIDTVDVAVPLQMVLTWKALPACRTDGRTPPTQQSRQPVFRPLRVGRTADGGVGFLNGILCGLTGFSGFIITIWCQLRGWKKDFQRAVFQPVLLAAIVANVISLAAARAITVDTLRLYLIGLPAMVAGLWVGFRLYGKLDDAAFRKVILALLLIGGLGLILPSVV